MRAATLIGVDKHFRQLVQDALPLVRLSLRLLWWASPGLTLGIAAVLVLQSLMAPLPELCAGQETLQSGPRIFGRGRPPGRTRAR
jgi:hypothetical protein